LTINHGIHHVRHCAADHRRHAATVNHRALGIRPTFMPIWFERHSVFLSSRGLITV
jgi:hypothetical protein